MSSLISCLEDTNATRRAVVIGGIYSTGLLTLSLVGCSNNSTSEVNNDGGAGGDAPDPNRPKEAPMLRELVEAGDLPPLDDRIPVESDRLVLHVPEYGLYGGNYQGAVLGQGDSPWINRMIAFEPMLRPSHDLTEQGLPGILKEVEFNTEGTEYTLHLREGLRWSDGEPCTADDVMFAIEDVYFNQELHVTPPEILSVDGEPCVPNRIDDYTVNLSFPSPKGNFIDHASRQALTGGNLFYFPKHYMEQFLPHLNDGAEDLAEEAGYADWTSYWSDRHEYWNNIDKPVLTPWIITDPLNSGSVCIAERNPYYWKVDDDGAQLPYIDRLEFEIIQDEEVMLLNAVNGEIDFHARHFTSDQNRPVLADAQEEAGFHFVNVETTSMNRMVISLNLNHQDDELREIFQNKDFRIGLSHAIDRQEIIDTTLQRQGEPWQAAPHRESEYFDEEFAKQFTEYDVDIANEHLDAAGLTERDSSGYRLRSDGSRLTFQVDMTDSTAYMSAAMEMISTYWQEVGIDGRVNPMERTLFYDRKTADANQHDANVWFGDGGLRIEMLETRFWFPTDDESSYATQWARWYSSRGNDDVAMEPPEDTRRQMELYRSIQLEPDPDEQSVMFREILDIAREQFYSIGIALPSDGYGIVANDLRNVVDSYPDTWLYNSPGQIDQSMWFFDRE